MLITDRCKLFQSIELQEELLRQIDRSPAGFLQGPNELEFEQLGNRESYQTHDLSDGATAQQLHLHIEIQVVGKAIFTATAEAKDRAFDADVVGTEFALPHGERHLDFGLRKVPQRDFADKKFVFSRN